LARSAFTVAGGYQIAATHFHTSVDLSPVLDHEFLALLFGLEQSQRDIQNATVVVVEVARVETYITKQAR
jgi:hypothetical protein